jgi:hypothetical protein
MKKKATATMEEKKMAMEENNKERPKEIMEKKKKGRAKEDYGKQEDDSTRERKTVAGPHTPHEWSCSKGGSRRYIVAPFAPCLLFLLVSLPPLSLPPGAPPPSIYSLCKLDCFTKLSYVVASEPNAFKLLIAIF